MRVVVVRQVAGMCRQDYELCKFQDRCWRGPDRRDYVREDVLKDKRRPFRRCFAHPNCTAGNCPYVHVEYVELLELILEKTKKKRAKSN